jgi:hypothetical protein
MHEPLDPSKQPATPKTPPPEEGGDRSYHPSFVKKKRVRVKILLDTGKSCIGYMHVLWPDGRVSDVINDEREFLPITDASLEGESATYHILTLNKKHITLLLEIHNRGNLTEE